MARAQQDIYDLLIIGGGINGAGIARDAAGRGLKVALVERDDLATHTSSASTKLIHGGLRYLEYYEFRLVREALQERERLLAMAPHIIWPLKFVLPQPPKGRPGWMIALGLFLYDHLGGRKKLPVSARVQLDDPKWGGQLRPEVKRGFCYADCWVDDARLVALNAIDAATRGADILTGVEVVWAKVDGDHWRVTLAANPARVLGGTYAEVPSELRARNLVNAAGPWVNTMLDTIGAVARDGKVSLVKGSHIIVPQLYDGAHAFMLQNPDGRIVFTIPYEGRFTLIGTTDVMVDEAARGNPEITQDEVDYLCASANAYFSAPVIPEMVVHSYAGIRPLYDDGSGDAKAITRDYVLKLGRKDGPQLLSVFGGKLTTYRRLAEHALEKLAPWLPGMGKPWSASTPLPGGDIADADFDVFQAGLRERWPWLTEALSKRLARLYGTRMALILGDASSMADLGEDFGAGLTQAEVAYLCNHEWARTAEDILRRRTKMGLHCPPDTQTRLTQYLARRVQEEGK
ncbi:MAG: glycerol-3-phosphate dehydrogenase [Alphaproteobacteria bacterium]|nr:glycerol-3-phosphate dehydrogenase [Alphaproteobacteria bacterium]MDE2339916.1 glycerol-3-phosphate dehydrogenase [Alphaproteobacteria bacterium]